MCAICEHHRIEAINVALRAGVHLADVRRMFRLRVSIADVGEHRDQCLPREATAQPARSWKSRQRAARDEQRIMQHPAVMQAFGITIGPDYFDDEAARRFVCAGLLLAVKDAQRGDAEARTWIESEHARAVAGWIDLDDHWPPTPDQIAGARVTKTGSAA